jgi:hypothetical protein
LESVTYVLVIRCYYCYLGCSGASSVLFRTFIYAPIAASGKPSAGAVAVRRAISVVGLPASPSVAQ